MKDARIDRLRTRVRDSPPASVLVPHSEGARNHPTDNITDAFQPPQDQGPSLAVASLGVAIYTRG